MIFILLIIPAFSACAQPLDEYKAETFIKGNDTLLYRVLMPVNFNPEMEYPVVFVLHGSGERGNDNLAQLTHGSQPFLDSIVREKFPAIIVFPQCPTNSYWSNVDIATVNGKRTFRFVKGGKPTSAMRSLMRLVEDFEDRPYTDDDRLYVGGLSMGGMGTFEILRRMKGEFAAAFPICGGDNPKNVKKYKNIPLWIFHGAKDDIVPSEHSQIVADALKNQGSDVKFTLYPEANHNSWDQAFAEPQLLPWLFSHVKN